VGNSWQEAGQQVGARWKRGLESERGKTRSQVQYGAHLFEIVKCSSGKQVVMTGRA